MGLPDTWIHRLSRRAKGGDAPTPRKPPNREEEAIQRGIIDLAVALGIAGRDAASGLCPGSCIVFSVPNERKSNPIAVARLKAMGLLPGVADLVFVAIGGQAHFMEVKTKKGRLSPSQGTFRDDCQAGGVAWALVRSIDDAQDCFERWGLTTRRVK